MTNAETAEYNKKYRRSKCGLTNVLYGQMKARSTKREYEIPSYTVQEFREWCLTKSVYHELHKQWEENEFSKDFTPSIDRIDDYKSYEFSNIQLMTWKENNTKGKNDKRNGINNKDSMAVIQYTKEMKPVMQYPSAKYAGRSTNISHANINKVCHGKRKTAGSYIWEFVNAEASLGGVL